MKTSLFLVYDVSSRCPGRVAVCDLNGFRSWWSWVMTVATCVPLSGSVQERTGGRPCAARLVYQGIQLAPERSVAEYEVLCNCFQL